jgi:hypothetical protein
MPSGPLDSSDVHRFLQSKGINACAPCGGKQLDVHDETKSGSRFVVLHVPFGADMWKAQPVEMTPVTCVNCGGTTFHARGVVSKWISANPKP